MDEQDENLNSRARTERADLEPDEPLQSESAPVEEVPFHVPRD